MAMMRMAGRTISVDVPMIPTPFDERGNID